MFNGIKGLNITAQNGPHGDTTLYMSEYGSVTEAHDPPCGSATTLGAGHVKMTSGHAATVSVVVHELPPWTDTLYEKKPARGGDARGASTAHGRRIRQPAQPQALHKAPPINRFRGLACKVCTQRLRALPASCATAALRRIATARFGVRSSPAHPG